MPKKQSWVNGSIFLIPLKDSTCGVGQVISKEVMGLPTVAVFSVRVSPEAELKDVPQLKSGECLSLPTVSGGALDRKIWRVIGERDRAVTSGRSPNADFRATQWIGSRQYTDNVVEAFLNAFHGLEPWDDFADPQFLDKLLIPPHRRPEGVMLKKR